MIGHLARAKPSSPAQHHVKKRYLQQSALKNDDAEGVALPGQRAHELVELFEHGRSHQVDGFVVGGHPGDSTLNPDVKGLKIRKALEKLHSGDG
jgi:hypothetical protein